MQIKEKLLELLFTLIKEIHPHFHKNKIHMEDDFEKDLGLDSLSRVELISRVQETFHITLTQKALYEVQRPKELIELILHTKKDSSNNIYEIKSSLKLEEISFVPDNAETLIDVLKWHVNKHPHRVHIQLYEENFEGETITYIQLYENALKVASSLQELGLNPYECVAIMLPTGAEYFYSFFGILLAGGVPVPIYPPARPSQLEEHLRRHTHILNNCDAKILISTPQAKIVTALLKSYVQNIKEVVTIQEILKTKNTSILPQVHKKNTAFIQYTSGSTGDPKGVVLTHANLVANIKAMGERVHATSKDVFVSWLPLYHDMGLIGSWLASLYYSALFVVMSPLEFLAKPQRWLWAIHKYGGTLSASPNFGYEYTLHRLKNKNLKGLDLSSWRAAFNGAEAISPLSIKDFSEYFKQYGFNQKAMTPVYGLAESSVGLVFSTLNELPKIDTIQRELFMENKIAKKSTTNDTLSFVSCGLPLTGHQIRIVDTFGNELPSRHEGNLQFKGPSSTKGYYKNQKKTDELRDNSWLNTGDLAYIAEGELYITGRVKDIIIRAGRNIYPDQLEKSIGDIEGIRKGCVAIFGVIDKRTTTEQLVILAETKLTQKVSREELIDKIYTLCNDLLGSPADEVILAEPGAILKTSSGKIRRSATKDLFKKNRGKSENQNLWLQFCRLGIKSFFARIKRFFHFTKAYLFSGYCWTVFSICSFSAWLTLMILPSSLCRKAAYFFTKLATKLSFIPIEVKGFEKVKESIQNSIIVVNHASYLDSFILFATLPFEVSFVAKAELKNSFFTRIPLQKLNVHFVERFNFEKSLKDFKSLYTKSDKNTPLIIFPEGTFSRIPGLKPFHMGAFTLAVKKELSIIPIAIEGTRSILRDQSWFIHKGEIKLNIGKAITLKKKQKKLSQWDKSLILKEKSRNFILKHCKEPNLIYE